MTPQHTVDSLAKAADALARAEARTTERRTTRDALIRAAIAEGHAVSLIARTCDISRTAVRKIAAASQPGDDS